jgi:hypothetical protein
LYLRHYSARLRHSRRLRYRLVRGLLIMLPVVLLLFALAARR